MTQKQLTNIATTLLANMGKSMVVLTIILSCSIYTQPRYSAYNDTGNTAQSIYDNAMEKRLYMLTLPIMSSMATLLLYELIKGPSPSCRKDPTLDTNM